MTDAPVIGLDWTEGADAMSKEKLTADERRARVSSMRNSRMTYREIGLALGISPSLAHKDMQRLTAEWRESSAQSVNDLIERELQELDGLEKQAAMEFARQDPGNRSPRWLELRIRVKQARAKLLGLEDVRGAMEAAEHAKTAAKALQDTIDAVDDYTPEELALAYEALAKQ